MGKVPVGAKCRVTKVAEKPGEGAVSPPQGLHAVPDKVYPGRSWI